MGDYREYYKNHTHSHAPIPGEQINSCARYIAEEKVSKDKRITRLYWPYLAHYYQVKEGPKDSPEKCKSELPPELLRACKESLRAGNSIKDFKKQIKKMRPEEIDALIYEDKKIVPKKTISLTKKISSLSVQPKNGFLASVPPVALYGAAIALVGVVVLVAKGGKK